MSSIIVNNIGKRYAINSNRKSSLREKLANPREVFFSKVENFYAIKNISFQLNKGEVLGIIGKNGAGKSTLLKILSKITRPTTGSIEMYGRVASLLEVGTGFHPELTGRENIYLNGTILGMTRREVSDKIDEIISFSGITKFIDMPVKHYSSGMYVRLAFSVAAHLEPEILIVDEVLAVGDFEFQKKCLGKMEDVAKKGRTVLFVSHNLSAVQALCSRAILLEKGELKFDGDVDDAIKEYTQINENSPDINLSKIVDRKGNNDFIFSDYTFMKQGVINNKFFIEEDITLKLKVFSKTQNPKNIRIDVGLNNSFGHRISWLSTSLHKSLKTENIKNEFFVTMVLKKPLLVPGSYNFNLNLIVDGVNEDWLPNVCHFEILSTPFFESGKMPPTKQGDFLVKHNFYISES